jgi:tubulin polyglutamylase TTLL6/13
MHLTNYSINKNSTKFNCDEEGAAGTKRSISSVMAQLKREGYEIDHLWEQIAVSVLFNDFFVTPLLLQDLIVKTLISIQPHLVHQYATCFPNDINANAMFEILGFDVIFQKKKNQPIIPVLLEVKL